MKKLFVLLTACLLLAAPLTGAFAATLDLSYVRENSDIFTIDPNEAGNAYFIETQLTAEHLHFTHKYESEYYWSSTQFDVLCLGMNGNDQYPVWRLWVVYANDQRFQNIDSVTFILDGKSYTFTGVSDPDLMTKNDTSYLEELLIKFGTENIDFCLALEDNINNLEDISDFQMTMILHGDEDITVTLGESFALDFALTKQVYIKLDGLSSIDRVGATPMNVK